MRKVIKCLKDELKDVQEPKIFTPLSLLKKMMEQYYIDQRTLKHSRDRLTSLLNTLEVDKLDEFSSLNVIADFSTLIATYYEGFSLILEPHPEERVGGGKYMDPLL